MSTQQQPQPAKVMPRKPTVYHWIRKGGTVALCGEQIPPQRQRHGAAAQTGRSLCQPCENLRLIENDLGW